MTVLNGGVMNFTPEERRLVEGLRKKERQWRVARWILLPGGVVTMTLWGWLLWIVFHRLDSQRPEEAAEMVAFVYPTALFGLSAAAFMMALAIRDWRGNPERVLLLKLLDEHVEPCPRPDQASPPASARPTPKRESR
jgi:hypothetical protein